MDRRLFLTVFSGGASLTFSPAAMLDSASVSDVVGTAVARGTKGTPTWSLADNAGGKYAIDGSTGVVTVAGALSAGTDSITISVTGVTPALDDKAFSISVSAADATTDDDWAAWVAAAA